MKKPTGMNVTAVCVSGLERTFPEIGINIRTTIVQAFHRLHFFGVQPSHEPWEAVQQVFQFVRLVPQRELCATVPNGSHFMPRGAVRGFVASLCDLQHCEEIISEHEERKQRLYATVARLRLDLFWEMPLVLPAQFIPRVVHVPWMSYCHGTNDKFAVGERTAMRDYLTRVRHLDQIVRFPLVAARVGRTFPHCCTHAADWCLYPCCRWIRRGS